MKPGALIALVACSGGSTIAPSTAQKLPPSTTVSLDPTDATDTGTKELRRMVPPEAYLRSYLMWFGGLSPIEIEKKAKGRLFDSWPDYLNALGLPDYKRDAPRQEQTNTLMLATYGRLGEALCARAAEHDLHERTLLASRLVFRFDPVANMDQATFTPRFEVLHRKFLGYPVRLAPADRVPRFFALYRDVARRHASDSQPLTGDEAAWAAVCSALVQHPEAELY